MREGEGVCVGACVAAVDTPDWRGKHLQMGGCVYRNKTGGKEAVMGWTAGFVSTHVWLVIEPRSRGCV